MAYDQTRRPSVVRKPAGASGTPRPTPHLAVPAANPEARTTPAALVCHAAAAFALGQTVSRIVVGEGKPWQRIGRDPQVLIGSVLMGSGFTMLHDPRRHGYKIRATVVLLLAPMMSLLRGAAVWELSAGWLLAARTASVIFAAANLSLAVVTLIRGSTSVRRRRLQRRLLTELAHPDTE